MTANTMRRMNVLRRERQLAHAASDVLYWLGTLDIDLGGLLTGERVAIDSLLIALRPYEAAGVISFSDLTKHLMTQGKSP